MLLGLNVQNVLPVISRRKMKMGNNYAQSAGVKAGQHLVLKLNYSSKIFLLQKKLFSRKEIARFVDFLHFRYLTVF